MIVIMMHHLGMTSRQQLVDTCHWLAYVSILLAATENHANPHCGCMQCAGSPNTTTNSSGTNNVGGIGGTTITSDGVVVVLPARPHGIAVPLFSSDTATSDGLALASSTGRRRSALQQQYRGMYSLRSTSQPEALQQDRGLYSATHRAQLEVPGYEQQGRDPSGLVSSLVLQQPKVEEQGRNHLGLGQQQGDLVQGLNLEQERRREMLQSDAPFSREWWLPLGFTLVDHVYENMLVRGCVNSASKHSNVHQPVTDLGLAMGWKPWGMHHGTHEATILLHDLLEANLSLFDIPECLLNDWMVQWRCSCSHLPAAETFLVTLNLTLVGTSYQRVLTYQVSW
jgi:hypothetical protein